MPKELKKTLLFSLIFFSIICALLIGQSWDESFNLNNGKITLNYLLSLGQIHEKYFYSEYYSPIYWTLNYFITQIFPNKYQIEISHLVNLSFSLSAVIAFGKIGKELFNKQIGNILMFLIILYPIFFGHMAINSKDTILAFCHGWLLYLIIRYLKTNQFSDRSRWYIYKIGFLLALATGIQFLFFGTLITIIIFLFLEIYYFKNIIQNNFNKKRFLFDILKVFLSFYFILVLFWPDTHSNIFLKPYTFFIELITSDLWRGWPYNLLNGKAYVSSETPKYYFLVNFIFKSPEFIIASYLFFLLFFININKFYKRNIKNFNYKIFLIFSVLLIPFVVPFLVPYPVYDGMRLFIWSLPYFCIIPSLVLFFLYKNIKSKINKVLGFSLGLLFLLYFTHFILITPYQYTYLNTFNNIIGNKQNKFENDYWGTSLKDLINKINVKNKELNIAFCGVNIEIAKKYIEKQNRFKANYTKINEAEYIIMTNRTSFEQKNDNSIETCFEIHKGKDVAKVERLGLTLSVFRELQK